MKSDSSNLKLTFYGGATHVTGANHLLEGGGMKCLVDCGMIQGSRYDDEMNHQPFGYDPSTVDALFITHSHVDHIGRIPKLYRDGFRGPIYASEPTAAIVAIALPDTLDKVVSEGREYGVPPLWDKHDMEESLALMRGIPYKKTVRLNDNVTVTGHDCGHVLGSTIWDFAVREGTVVQHVAFPGDIGNPPSVLLPDIDYVHGVDYTLVESAYGNRIHEPHEMRRKQLLDVLVRTFHDKSVLMIPSFAVERTQEILLEMDALFDQGKLPKMPVFVDSPLAIRITEVYGKFSNYFNERAREVLRDNKGLFKFPWLTFTDTVQQSKGINDIPAPKVIIAGSGMSQGGRIIHHERRYLSDPHNTILFIGYQVQGSLGRRIKDGATEVHILGERVPVRCHIQSIEAYSAHADQNGLIEYLKQTAEGGKLKKAFVVQGEENAAQALADRAATELGIEAIVPRLGESFEL